MIYQVVSVGNIFFLMVFLHSRQAKSHKITNGTDATEGQFPYQLSLNWNGNHWCGASLVALGANRFQYAITAAHCFYTPDENGKYNEVPISELILSGGSVNRQSSQNQFVQVTGKNVHSNFVPGRLGYYDIALLYFQRQFDLTKPNIKPIELNQRSVERGNLNVTGWGWTQWDDPGSSPEVLKYTTMPIVSYEECKVLENNKDKIYPNMNICGGVDSATCRNENF